MPFRSILSPIDFDHNSLAALDLAAQFARVTNAKIVLMHVVPSVPSRAKLPAYVDLCLREERAARARLEEIAGTRLGGLPYEIITRTGQPAVAIIHAEEELKPDLVVIATHSCKRTPHELTGSVAEKVVRESICPVLTLRACPVADVDSVGAHMTPGPVTVTPDATASAVWDKMVERRVRCIPVVEGDRLVGIITDRDLSAPGRSPDSTPISQLMTREVVTVTPHTSIQEAARLLLECEVGGLPVMEKDILVGLLTTSDILQAFAAGPPQGARPLKSITPARQRPRRQS